MSRQRSASAYSLAVCALGALLVGCRDARVPASAPPEFAHDLPRVSPRPPPSATSVDTPAAPARAPVNDAPRCEPGQIAWQPAHCGFDVCTDGKLVGPLRDELRDCLRPLALYLTFDRNSTTLAVQQLAELENLAAKAEVLGVQQLSVLGRQNWDEAPDLHAKVPLSLARANAVQRALAAATHIPITVNDGGTQRRRYGLDDRSGRTVEVGMTPLDASHLPAASAPFTLPWLSCESEVTFRTVLSMTTHDGIVVAEICRNGKCSRAGMDSTYHAVWPGGMGSVMNGDFQANLSLEPTAEQLVRNGQFELGTGEGPASFNLRVSLHDASIRETDQFRFRLYRRRTELALDWSGKLEFTRRRPHPTRDVPPCLSAVRDVEK